MGSRSFLTEEQARAIHADRRSYGMIARDYGISPMTVSHIKKGQTWAHLGLTPVKRHKSLEQYEREQRRPTSDGPASDGDDGNPGRGQATNPD